MKGGDRTDRPAPTLEPDYTYDPLGNLLTVNQNGVSGGVARKRSFTYDSLSRLACASNPETEPAYTACPTNTTGTLSYTYDANGNVSSKTYTGGTIGTVTYPNLTTTYGNYDGLNRVGLKSYSDGTPSVSYAYDASAVQTTGNLNGGWHRRPPWRAALYFTTTPARVTTNWAGQQDTRSARASQLQHGQHVQQADECANRYLRSEDRWRAAYAGSHPANTSKYSRWQQRADNSDKTMTKQKAGRLVRNLVAGLPNFKASGGLLYLPVNNGMLTGCYFESSDFEQEIILVNYFATIVASLEFLAFEPLRSDCVTGAEARDGLWLIKW